MIYFSTFFVTFIIVNVANTLRKHELVFSPSLLELFATLIISLLSYYKDYSIGTDVYTYGNDLFNSALFSHSVIQFANYAWIHSGIEVGYSVITYIVAHLLSNPHIFYFLLTFFVSLIIIICLRKFQGGKYTSIGWVVYCFLYYANFINLLRQSLAVVLVLLAIVYMVNKKTSVAFWLIVSATVFHETAVIAFLIFLVYLLIGHKLHLSLFVRQVLAFIVVALLPFVITIVGKAGFLSTKYTQYVTQTRWLGTDNSLWMGIAIRVPFIVIGILVLVKQWKNYRSDQEPNNVQVQHNELFKSEFLLIMLIWELILNVILRSNFVLIRTELYFGISKVISYPYFLDKMFNNRIYKVIAILTAIILLAAVFYFQVIVGGSNHIYPYIVSPDF